MSERPVTVCRDDTGRLHGEGGPALVYEDGWSVYFWRGVSVRHEWLWQRARLDAVLVMRWPDGEQRRALAEMCGGWDAVLARLPTRVVDEDEPSVGTLLEYEPDRRNRFLRVRCGTGRTFVLPVPRWCRTAREGNAWTYGLEAREYHPEVRT